MPQELCDVRPANSRRRLLCRRSLHPPFNSSFTLTHQDSQPYRPDVPSFRPFHDSKLTVQPTAGEKERDGNACFTPRPAGHVRNKPDPPIQACSFQPSIIHAETLQKAHRSPPRCENAYKLISAHKTGKQPKQAADGNILSGRPQGGGGPQDRETQKTRDIKALGGLSSLRNLVLPSRHLSHLQPNRPPGMPPA